MNDDALSESVWKRAEQNARDAERYRRIRAARDFVGMLEFATAHASTDAEYDAAIDKLPVKP